MFLKTIVYAKIQAQLKAVLLRELPLTQSWTRLAAAALVPAGVLLIILFFLEPNGTDRYDSETRTLRLSGYALCVVLPILAVHRFDLWMYRRQKSFWCVANAICSRSFTLFAIAASSYLYNALVINNVGVSLGAWIYFSLHFGLPYAVLLLPPLIYAEHRFAGAEQRVALQADPQERPSDEVHTYPNATICICGKNNEEQLAIPAAAFLYAQALQNYVSIVFFSGPNVSLPLEKRVFRATLTEISSQIPASRRIHRSHLINPQHLLRIETSKRKRVAVMRHLETPLPVSAELAAE